MHASPRLFKLWPPSIRNAWRLSTVLCTGAALCDLGACITAQPMHPSLLALNFAAFISVCYARRRTARSIQLEPQELASQMLQVQETERQRLSRELHDDIGQMLTAAKLQCDWLLRRLPADLAQGALNLNGTLDETLGKVRDVSALLNPRQLASLGLEASLRAHLLRTLATTRLHWSLECHQRLAGLPDDMAVAAFRITQEAVTNVLRHAEACNLAIRLQRSAEGLRLSIEDDGLGFQPDTDPARLGQRGLSGMHERANLLGGQLSVDSHPGKGTHVQALFPWPAGTRERSELRSQP